MRSSDKEPEMNESFITRLAIDCGLINDKPLDYFDPRIIEFAHLIEKHQREMDAQICESMDHLVNASHCAAAIRNQE